MVVLWILVVNLILHSWLSSTMENKNKKNKKQPMKYWLVQFTLTSGEIVEFYVSAINEYEAYNKSDSYSFMVENPKLRNKLKGFKLLA